MSNILVHEEYDKRRAYPLVKKLKAEKRLRNPIIVADLGHDQYLQLDGMNRFSAFQAMKLPSIIAQIIDYNDQDIVELSSWVHMFSSRIDAFFHYLSEVDSLVVKEGRLDHVGHRYIKEEETGRLCTIVTHDEKVYLISSNGSLVSKINKLNKIVSYYKDHIVRDALPQTISIVDLQMLFKQHQGFNNMVVFPTFTRHQIIDIVKQGILFPPGVTRHMIKRRCLHVNMPMSLFSNGKSIEEQNLEMEKKLAARTFRLYEEPTIYFE